MMINDKQLTPEQILKLAGIPTEKEETGEVWIANYIYDFVRQTSNPDNQNNHPINSNENS